MLGSSFLAFVAAFDFLKSQGRANPLVISTMDTSMFFYVALFGAIYATHANLLVSLLVMAVSLRYFLK